MRVLVHDVSEKKERRDRANACVMCICVKRVVRRVCFVSRDVRFFLFIPIPRVVAQ